MNLVLPKGFRRLVVGKMWLQSFVRIIDLNGKMHFQIQVYNKELSLFRKYPTKTMFTFLGLSPGNQLLLNTPDWEVIKPWFVFLLTRSSLYSGSIWLTIYHKFCCIPVINDINQI